MSEPVIAMGTVLTSKGWIMFYQCNCSGYLRQHFNKKEKPGYEIVIRPTRNTFRIKLNNHLIGGPFWNYDLEKKMTELIT